MAMATVMVIGWVTAVVMVMAMELEMAIAMVADLV